ncbi:MAG: hypothetical protein ACFFAT_14695 [Promethearchaeota archaeon]
MTNYIAFDGGHKCRGNIDENYSQLKELLNSNNFECVKFIDMITQSTLKPYDILVFACPDFAKITPQEINEMEAWVKNDGGGLLLLSHAGGDRGRSSNLNELAELFGIAFENDQVLDDKSNLGLENLPIIYNTNFNPPHTITNDIDSICYRAGCSLSIIGEGAFAIATSNETSDPFQTPLICISEMGNGRVCAIGSYEMFRNKVGGGLGYKEHTNLALNLFKWLVSETRSDIRISQGIQPPSTQVRAPTEHYHAAEQQNSPGRSVDIDTANISYDIRISKKSELMALLKLFSDQIHTIQKTIDVLIEKVALEDDATFQGASYSQATSDYQYQQEEYQDQYEQQYTDYEQYDSSYEELTGDESFIDYEYQTQGKHTLSSLPERPSSLKDAEEQSETLSAPKFKSSSKSKGKKSGSSDVIPDTESLEAEKQSLGSKVNSVKELISFIDKKHKSGKLDDKSHDKQIKKLEKDLNKAQSRIDAINKILKK